MDGATATDEPGTIRECVYVPTEALDRLLTAAEAVGRQYGRVHPVLRECHKAALAVREAIR